MCFLLAWSPCPFLVRVDTLCWMLGKQKKAMLVRFNPKTDLHVKVIRSQIEPRQYHFFRVLRFPSFLLKVSSVMFFSVFFFGMSSDHLIFLIRWCNFFFLPYLVHIHICIYSTFSIFIGDHYFYIEFFCIGSGHRDIREILWRNSIIRTADWFGRYSTEV